MVTAAAQPAAPDLGCHPHTCTWRPPSDGQLWHLHRAETRPSLSMLLKIVLTRFAVSDHMCVTAPDLEVHAVIERISVSGAVIEGSTPEGDAVKLDLRKRQVTVRPRLRVV